MRVVSTALARRLFILKQRLAGPRPAPDSAGILGLVRELGCLQLDPISVVARSHRIVLFSRLGAYPEAALEQVLWEDRSLFEYWAHAASIVLTEDFPLHRGMMRNHGNGKSAWIREMRQWMTENADLEQHVFEELQARGPLASRHFEDKTKRGWETSGWNSGRNVSRMLDFLWLQGRILVAGRAGLQKLWDLAERVLPAQTPSHELSAEEIVRRAVPRSLRALGVARKRHIEQHFLRGRYPGIAQVLSGLVSSGEVLQVQIRDGGDPWPGPWYLHAEDLPLLEQLEAGDWQPRTTLLSPFDNLICDRARTEQIFGFEFRLEIYTPQVKRRHGYYVLPVLHGDRLIGRIDPAFDRKAARLDVHAVHAEPDAPKTKAAAQAVAAAVEELASWLGAASIAYGKTLPSGWKRWLR